MARSRGSAPTCSALMLWSSTIIRSNCEARSQHRWLWLQSPRRRVRTSCVCWATVRFPSSTWAGGGCGERPRRHPPWWSSALQPLLRRGWRQGRGGGAPRTQRWKKCQASRLVPSPAPGCWGPGPSCLSGGRCGHRGLKDHSGDGGSKQSCPGSQVPPQPCSPQPVTDSGYRVQPLPRGGGHFKLPHSPGSDRPPPSWLLPSPACFPSSFLLSVSLCPLNCTEVPVPGSASREPTRTTGF